MGNGGNICIIFYLLCYTVLLLKICLPLHFQRQILKNLKTAWELCSCLMQDQPRGSDEPAWRLKKPPAILFLAGYEDICQFLDVSGLHNVCLSNQVQIRNQNRIREMLNDRLFPHPSHWVLCLARWDLARGTFCVLLGYSQS